ncbi:MAG TPA: GTP 3',8-cyclase MoaA [Pirellulales bacterium]|jgi:cyclic pyranopterin phosphate synthase|nr:GTP 3',8-cyclase MoaA [Pirellulales bacterium]
MNNCRLIDGLGRVHTNLRISVTDRCNLRCFYCMPAENVRFRPTDEMLTAAEIERFVRAVVPRGISKVRLSGGEPTLRDDLAEIVARVAAVPGLTDLALTTNGLRLADQAAGLRAAGLGRINISLDTLRADAFRRIARREGLDRVLAGIFAARDAGFRRIKLNAVAIRGLTEEDVVPLAMFAREHDLQMRFIEFMPLDADGAWRAEQVLSRATIRAIVEPAIGPLLPLTADDPGQVASDYRFADGRGRIGFINPVTQPFCSRCNRLRLTAEGRLRNCLFSTVEWDVRGLLRGGGQPEQIVAQVEECLAAKRPGHGIQTAEFVRPERAMYQIGG